MVICLIYIQIKFKDIKKLRRNSSKFLLLKAKKQGGIILVTENWIIVYKDQLKANILKRKKTYIPKYNYKCDFFYFLLVYLSISE